MGVFDTYCALCSGPLKDTFTEWRDFLTMSGEVDTWPPQDGEWRNPSRYPVPTRDIREIIRISQEDGKCWEDWVCLGPLWPDYVSPTCVEGSYGSIMIDGVDMTNTISRPVRIHRTCLSLFCNFTHSTPQAFYESLHGEGSDYRRYGEAGNGLLYCLVYFDIQGRSGQSFAYALEKQALRKDEPDAMDRWVDPDTMEVCNWLFACPTVFPTVPSLPINLISTAASPSNQKSIMSAVNKVLHLPEVLDHILSVLVERTVKNILLEERLSSGDAFLPASIDRATHAVFALQRVNKHLYDHIITSRQDLFLSLAWQHAWILPCTALDQYQWEKSNPQIALAGLVSRSSRRSAPEFLRQSGRDWRTYLLTFLRKDKTNGNPHVKNRWRLYRMALQCARGKKMPAREGVEAWKWHCGDAGYTPVLAGTGNSEREHWELKTAGTA